MLGHPVAAVAPLLGVLREVDGRAMASAAAAVHDGDEVEDVQLGALGAVVTWVPTVDRVGHFFRAVSPRSHQLDRRKARRGRRQRTVARG